MQSAEPGVDDFTSSGFIFAPQVVITDKWQSCGAIKREIPPGLPLRQGFLSARGLLPNISGPSGILIRDAVKPRRFKGREVLMENGGRHRDRHASAVVLCALVRRIDSPGEIPGRLTVVPAESTWGGSGGDEWAEAPQDKAVSDGQRTMRAAA